MTIKTKETIRDFFEGIWFLLKGLGEGIGFLLSALIQLLIVAIIIFGGWKLLMWILHL